MHSPAAQYALPPSLNAFDAWIALLRSDIARQAPELLEFFDPYAGEALFGRQWLDEALKQLPPGSAVLEIGAGMFLLACQLVREGFAVTALEPVGSGFGHFHQLQKKVLAYAANYQAVPEILPHTAETLAINNRFAFAYSLNVMEHVGDVQTVLARVLSALKPGAPYRFVCPNYAFPFETHFGIPIIINKNITLAVLGTRIRQAPNVGDPQGLWESLNWITVRKIRQYCKTLGVAATFNRSILSVYLDRALNEPSFCARHPLIHRLVSVMRMVGALQLVRLVPLPWTPVIDCTVTKVDV